MLHDCTCKVRTHGDYTHLRFPGGLSSVVESAPEQILASSPAAPASPPMATTSMAGNSVMQDVKTVVLYICICCSDGSMRKPRHRDRVYVEPIQHCDSAGSLPLAVPVIIASVVQCLRNPAVACALRCPLAACAALTGAGTIPR